VYHKKDAGTSLLKNAFAQEKLKSNNARGEVKIKSFAKECDRSIEILVSEYHFEIGKCYRAKSCKVEVFYCIFIFLLKFQNGI